MPHIARIWMGRTTPDKANDYVGHLQGTIFPELRNIAGHRGAYILRRNLKNGAEFTIITLWESMEAIHQFAGEKAEIAVVPPEARALLTQFDATVKHYEIVSGPELMLPPVITE